MGADRRHSKRVGKTTFAALILAFALVLPLSGGALARGSSSDSEATKTPGTAQPVPKLDTGSSKGAPAQSAEAKASSCDLRPSAHKSSKDEWLSCIGVSASLSRAPALGETAVLTYRVSADARRDGAKIVVELPANLQFVDSAGAVVSLDALVGGGLRGNKAVESRDLAAGGTYAGRMVVRALAPGSGEIRVRANAKNGRNVDGGSDSVFLTVDKGASKFGIDVPRYGAVAEVPAGVTVAKHAPARNAKPIPGKIAPTPVSELPSTSGAAADAVGSDAAESNGPQAVLAQAFATGSWSYQDQTATWRPGTNIVVQLWDEDYNSPSGNPDDFLGSTFVGTNGVWNIAFENADPDGAPGADPYALFITDNSRWRVENGANGFDYRWVTGEVINVADGSTTNYGSLTTGDPALHRALHAYDEINDAWFWVPIDWDVNNTPNKHIVNWNPTSTDGTYWNGEIHLAAADPDSAILVLHELGHGLMYDIYDNTFPPAPNCNPHSINGISSQGCAWTEGWAEWFPATVYNDWVFRWADGSTLNLENPTWGSGGWDNGDALEGRIAGSLIDIDDGNNEGPWDRISEGDQLLWDTSQDFNSNNLADFWGDRAAHGEDTGNDFGRAALYQNTIDYGPFRDPYASDVERALPPPPSQAPIPLGSSNNHNSVINVSSAPWWSIIAERPASSDIDLRVYDDYGQTVLVEQSTFGSSTTDYVVFDGNSLAANDYYPRNFQFSGSSSYDVEFIQGSSPSLSGTPTQVVNMSAGEVAVIKDVSMTAGDQWFFRVVPSNSGQNAELFLMATTSGDATTYVQRRSDAVAADINDGAGVAEGFSYTGQAGQGSWKAIVLLNRAGTGDYTLYADMTVPTGSIVIEGGATHTPDTNVSLTLSATDAQTSVDQMRISTDGTMDSEPWQAYATSANVTLPAGDGLKTVLVQYRNYASMDSAVFSDDITLDTTPCSGAATTMIGTPGSDTITGTAGPDVIRGLAGNDIIKGLGGDDTICGGDGNDTLLGGSGNDKLLGELHNDTIAGHGGNDELRGGPGTNRVSYSAALAAVTVDLSAGTGNEGTDTLFEFTGIIGSPFNDVLRGNASANNIQGRAGNDLIDGRAGNDALYGGDGLDTLIGGGGNDFGYGENGNDTIRLQTGNDGYNGGPGIDRATLQDATAPLNANLNTGVGSGDGSDTFQLIEDLTGGPLDDILTGNSLANTILGLAGNDDLFGLDGNDTLNGGAGNDDIDGGLGTDTCIQGSGTGTLTSCP